MHWLMPRNVDMNAGKAWRLHGRWRYLARFAAIFSLPLMLTSCPVPLSEVGDLRFASQDPELSCTVTVRNAGAPGGAPQISLTNVARHGDGIDPAIVRPYYIGRDCFTGVREAEQWGYGSETGALADWRRFYPRRMAQLAADPSLFEAFPGTWCEVAGSARCERAGGTIGECLPSPALFPEDIALQPCPPLPDPVDTPGAACLDISCGAGDATCALTANSGEIQFGQVPVGAAGVHGLVLNHCGEDGDDNVELTADGAIINVTPFADFTIPIPADPANPQPAENACYPPSIANSAVRVLAPGEDCTIPVIFNPQSGGLHEANTTITSNARPDFRADLSGNAQSGSLSFAVAGAPVDVADPAEVCFDNRTGGCTVALPLEITNTGVGVITISDIRFEPVDQRFEFDPPVAAPLTVPGGQSLTIGFKWCGGASQTGDADLVIESNDPNPDNALLRIPVTRTDVQDGCP